MLSIRPLSASRITAGTDDECRHLRDHEGVSGRLVAARLGIITTGAILGVVGALAAYEPDALALWTTDAAVAVTFAWAAAVALPRFPAVATMSAAVAITWSLAAYLPATVFWHRAALIALLLSAPRFWPRSALARVGVVVSAIASAVPVVWASDTGALVLIAGLAAVIAALWRRLLLLPAAVATVVALGIASAWRLLLPDPESFALRSIVYAVTLVVVGSLIIGRVRADRAAQITDAAVLVSAVPRSLRERLASAAGDADLEIEWRDDQGGASTVVAGRGGTPVDALPAGRAAIEFTVPGRGAGRIVCAEDIAADAKTATALRSAVLLTEESQRLDAALAARRAEIAESRARLVTREDAERAAIRRRLDREVMAPLLALAGREDLPPRAVELVALAVGRLRDIPVGVPPSELDEGLAAALRVLADRAPIHVDVDAVAVELEPAVAAAVYYACAEALSNVAKHAGVNSARIFVRSSGGVCVASVVDEGRGGVRVDGHGILSMTDRVDALGGSVEIRSSEGRGTIVSFRVPAPRSAVGEPIAAKVEVATAAAAAGSIAGGADP